METVPEITWWICGSEANKEFLESIGVTLGPYADGYWTGCTIPWSSMNDLYEYWGSGNGDTFMFDREDIEQPEPIMERIARVRERVVCSLCSSAIAADGTCSYPFCPSWTGDPEVDAALEREPQPDEEAESEEEPVTPRAARLRQ